MRSHITRPACAQPATEASPRVFDNWFDPIETGVRERVRGNRRKVDGWQTLDTHRSAD